MRHFSLSIFQKSAFIIVLIFSVSLNSNLAFASEYLPIPLRPGISQSNDKETFPECVSRDSICINLPSSQSIYVKTLKSKFETKWSLVSEEKFIPVYVGLEYKRNANFNSIVKVVDVTDYELNLEISLDRANPAPNGYTKNPGLSERVIASFQFRPEGETGSNPSSDDNYINNDIGIYLWVAPPKVEPTTSKENNEIEILNQRPMQSSFSIQLRTPPTVKWPKSVVANVVAKGKGTQFCIANFQDEFVSFQISAGQSKKILLKASYREQSRFKVTVGCAERKNWWGRVFDQRYSWSYAQVRATNTIAMT